MNLEENYKNLTAKAKAYTGIDVTYTRTRKFEIVMIKACIINILYRYFGGNTVQIGKLLNMHHSTIIYHESAHANRYKNEGEYGALYDYLARQSMSGHKSLINVDEMVQIMRRTMTV